MTYVINYTNIENGIISVQDNSVNTETDLRFPGSRSTDYASIISENFLHLLENFANPIEPEKPIQGQLWYKTSAAGNQLQIYDGARWTAAGGLKQTDQRPDAAVSNPGDLWSDTDSNQLYFWTGTRWILVGPQFSDGLTSGPVVETVIDTTDNEQTIIKNYVNGNVVAILATTEFIPKLNIPGFSVIKPGITLAGTSYFGSGTPKYYGISESAETLIVNNTKIQAARFLRSDIESITNQKFIIKNNKGIDIGLDSQMNINVSGTRGFIEHKTASSSIDVRTTTAQGERISIAHFSSNQRVGINTTSPDDALHVVGNIKTDNDLLVTEDLSVLGNTTLSGNLEVVGNTVLENLTTKAIVPVATETYDLGSASNKWDVIHANLINATVQGNIVGNLSGNSTTASRLENVNSIELVGEVTAPEVEFDGAGEKITLTTSIGSLFISNQDEVTTTGNSDEFLIQRGTELFKITEENLFKNLPRNPPGVILPYAGASAPSAAWLMCDGSEVEISAFPELFAVIRYTYKSSAETAPGRFGLPDLRGRTLLGMDNMGGTSANRVRDTEADQLGGFDGQDQITINAENLPDHEHNLRGYNSDGTIGNQFYALRDVNETPTDVGAIGYDAPTGTQGGQALPTSGKILTDGLLGQPINVMNPYLALNFIIYTGKE